MEREANCEVADYSRFGELETLQLALASRDTRIRDKNGSLSLSLFFSGSACVKIKMRSEGNWMEIVSYVGVRFRIDPRSHGSMGNTVQRTSSIRWLIYGCVYIPVDLSRGFLRARIKKKNKERNKNISRKSRHIVSSSWGYSK